jgi:hypothetical protein
MNENKRQSTELFATSCTPNQDVLLVTQVHAELLRSAELLCGLCRVEATDLQSEPAGRTGLTGICRSKIQTGAQLQRSRPMGTSATCGTVRCFVHLSRKDGTEMTLLERCRANAPRAGDVISLHFDGAEIRARVEHVRRGQSPQHEPEPTHYMTATEL